MNTATIIRRLTAGSAAVILLIAAFFGTPSLDGTANARPIDRTGTITDRSSDIEVARYAYRDYTMHRFTHEKAVAYARGRMTAKQATRSLNKHLHRYCASARMISRALSDRGYNSATIQNFYYRSGCMRAPRVTHNSPRR